MRKRNVLICVVLLLVFGCVLLGVIYRSTPRYEVSDFSYTDYTSQLNTLAVSHVVEPVENAEDAVIKATMLWNQTYGYVIGEYNDPNPGKGISVYYDQRENCWLITGTPPKTNEDVDYVYSMPHVIIRDTGEAFSWMG